VPMSVPFVGLILGDFNYIIQCAFMDSNEYLLLLSDLVFGFCGGFTAIIGTLFSYAIKTTSPRYRSDRMASFEGAIGLGSTLGYALSGVLREAVGYTYVFLIMAILHIIALTYICVFAKNLESIASDESPSSTVCASIWRRFTDFRNLFVDTRDKMKKRFLVMTLVSLAIELVVFAGVSDILFSFLRYRLAWTDKQYGWFNGVGSALNSITVLVVYPLLHKKMKVPDTMLAIFGIVTRALYLLMIAFVQTSWMAFLATAPWAFNRFVSTGTRSMASQYVSDNEQGKVFTLIALLEGVSFTIATFIFNGLYPLTLHFFAGTLFLVVAVSMLIPFTLISYVHTNSRNHGHDMEEESLHSSSTS
jgi:hypothetical protein